MWGAFRLLLSANKNRETGENNRIKNKTIKCRHSHCFCFAGSSAGVVVVVAIVVAVVDTVVVVVGCRSNAKEKHCNFCALPQHEMRRSWLAGGNRRLAVFSEFSVYCRTLFRLELKLRCVSWVIGVSLCLLSCSSQSKNQPAKVAAVALLSFKKEVYCSIQKQIINYFLDICLFESFC